MANELWITLRGATATNTTDILKVPGGMIVRTFWHGIMALTFVKVESDSLDHWIAANRAEVSFLPPRDPSA